MGDPIPGVPDRVVAALDLVRRTGASELQFGYLHEDVPVDEADWWAHAQYQGARIMVEEHIGPEEALEALAQRLLTGAKCAHCGGLVALSDKGAWAWPGLMADGTSWSEDEIRRAGQCRWRRVGSEWVRGCET